MSDLIFAIYIPGWVNKIRIDGIMRKFKQFITVCTWVQRTDAVTLYDAGSSPDPWEKLAVRNST